MTNKTILIAFSYFLIVTIATSCASKGCTDPMASNYNPSAQKDNGSCNYAFASDEDKAEFAENYAEITYAMYQDAYQQAVAMREVITQFLDNPTIPGLEACKDAWILARIPYSQTEALHFPGSPGLSLHPRVNGWGFQPRHIDYVAGNDSAGIINQPASYPIINAEVLLQTNNTNQGARITLGYHVIEFLLWGEDNDPAEDLTAGNRSFSDYVLTDTNVLNADRRQQYLKVCVDQLVTDLGSLVGAWSPQINNNFRKEFNGYSPNKRTRLALTGLVLFGEYELAINRIRGTLFGLDAEREESTFSDNTYRDIFYNVKGLQAVFDGRYGRTDSTYVSGTSLFEVIELREPVSADELNALKIEVVEGSKNLLAPFDYYMTLEQATGSGFYSDLSIYLENFGKALTEVATKLSMGIKQDIPAEQG